MAGVHLTILRSDLNGHHFADYNFILMATWELLSLVLVCLGNSIVLLLKSHWPGFSKKKSTPKHEYLNIKKDSFGCFFFFFFFVFFFGLQNWLNLLLINTLKPRPDGRHFPDDNFICIFLNENEWHSIKISLKFVPKVPINNIPAMVQIMAWRWPGDKPLSEPMMVSLLTHICVTRPQWVNVYAITHMQLYMYSQS